jgi:hypothetical protein
MAYYHYASRQGAQDIFCARRIIPGRSGKIYVTRMLYVVGAEAANELSITGKPVEMACEIPDNSVGAPTAPQRTHPLWGPDGTLIRRGGGEEVSTAQIIDARRLKWISLREP